MNRRRTLTALLLVMIAAGCLLVLPNRESSPLRYHRNSGPVFGTYYSIIYRSSEDLHPQIIDRLRAFDASLSTFNPHSTISVINQGRDTVWNEDFRTMYETAERINVLSHGAFDIRVAPLVNAWGFGFSNRLEMTPERVDSLRQIRNILDASAIAKGQGCDAVARMLESHGVTDYLVEIGGEVVARGHNDKGNPWHVGIVSPKDDPTGANTELERIVSSTSLNMATSGNYRQYYYDGGIRRSHTIDPRTGYPVQHSLLSATVTSTTCMEADALATACMVLGADSALMMINSIPDTECFLIVASDSGYIYLTSDAWKD